MLSIIKRSSKTNSKECIKMHNRIYWASSNNISHTRISNWRCQSNHWTLGSIFSALAFCQNSHKICEQSWIGYPFRCIAWWCSATRKGRCFVKGSNMHIWCFTLFQDIYFGFEMKRETNVNLKVYICRKIYSIIIESWFLNN